jgi:ABC transport system ATP-binding/permease protein
MPLITLDQVSISFGSLPLLDRVGLQIEANERVCLIGRNGAGKSTLLQIINGDQAPDSGSVYIQPGVQIARLVQDLRYSQTGRCSMLLPKGLGT